MATTLCPKVEDFCLCSPTDSPCLSTPPSHRGSWLKPTRRARRRRTNRRCSNRRPQNGMPNFEQPTRCVQNKGPTDPWRPTSLAGVNAFVLFALALWHTIPQGRSTHGRETITPLCETVTFVKPDTPLNRITPLC